MNFRIAERLPCAATCAALGLAFMTLVLAAPAAAQMGVNNAPVNTVPGAQSTAEDTNRVFTGGNLISVNDPDDADNAITGDEIVQVTLTATNGTITLSTTVGLTFSGGDGTADATMTFNGTLANVNAALSGLFFAPTFNFNGPASLQIVTNDLGNFGSGMPLSDTDSVAITVNAVNDQPFNTVPGAQGTNENTSRVFSTANGNPISVSDFDDADNATLGDQMVRVTLTATNGRITLAGTAGLTFIDGGGTAETTMTFTGTLTNVNNALSGLSFAPTANFNGPASLQIVSNDLGNSGSGAAITDTDSIAINVNAVNSAPVNTVPGPQSTPVNTSLVFSTPNSNRISVDDPDDADNAILGDEMLQVTLTATNGTITLSSAVGLTFTAGDGSADVSMTFSGSHTNIKNALSSVTFAPTAGFNGGASLQVVSNDLGNFGSGGPLSDTDSVAITVGTPPPGAPPSAGVLPATPASAPSATGARTAALKKCKKKRGSARKNCIKRAKKLPV